MRIIGLFLVLIFLGWLLSSLNWTVTPAPTPIPPAAKPPAPVVQTVIVPQTVVVVPATAVPPAPTQTSAPASTVTPTNTPTRTPASAQVFGLDRHGCPDQADHFMNQVEYTVDQPNGKVTSPAGTNVGFIWGWDLTFNGKNYGRKAVVLTKEGTLTGVTGAYRVRWHKLSKSTIQEYMSWSKCFVEKDEATTYDWLTFAP